MSQDKIYDVMTKAESLADAGDFIRAVEMVEELTRENVLSELEFVKIYYYSSRAELKNIARNVVAELGGGNN